MRDNWEDDVIAFWFTELTPDQWYKKDDAVDATIRERFMDTYEAVRAMDPAQLTQSPRRALAAIIVLDQFTRNMFRNSPRSFESDGLAQKTAEAAVAAGHDGQLSENERWFVYMPFMHAETLALQDRSIALFEALGNAEATRYAHLHRDIIVKFGRFPHRNAVLGRQSTPEEQAHVDEHGGF